MYLAFFLFLTQPYLWQEKLKNKNHICLNHNGKQSFYHNSKGNHKKLFVYD